MRKYRIKTVIKSYDMGENLMGTYSCIEEAAEKTGANPRGIYNCIHGRQFSSGGLRWKEEIAEKDILVISYFSWPYYYLLNGDKVHVDDTYFDENNILRRKP